MTVFRDRKFLEGIAVGGISGIIIGSILAFLAILLGESRIEAARRMIENRFPHHVRIPFEYLSQ